MADGAARRLGGVDRALLIGAAARPSVPRDLPSRPGPRNAETIGMRRVDFPAAAWDSFHNVNTSDDLEAARAQAAHFQTEDGALG
jgi:hypothetical protein